MTKNSSNDQIVPIGTKVTLHYEKPMVLPNPSQFSIISCVRRKRLLMEKMYPSNKASSEEVTLHWDNKKPEQTLDVQKLVEEQSESVLQEIQKLVESLKETNT